MTRTFHKQSKELVEVLLYLYECLTDPNHTEIMIETIGEWLSDDDNTLSIADLERHSQTILSQFETSLQNSKSDNAPPKVPDAILERQSKNNTQIVELIAHDLKGEFDTDEERKLVQFLEDLSETRCLCKAYRADESSVLCLIVKVEGSTGSRLELWYSSEDLNQSVEEMLKSDLGITHSEFLVVREIARGGKAVEIAERLGKSIETIKSQVKSIATKLGRSGLQSIQADINHLERIAKDSGIEQIDQSKFGKNHIVLKDGRKLHFSTYGPEKGTNVLFFHCFLHGRHLPKSIEAILDANNIRIISMSRSGFGESTLRNMDKETDLLTLNADDYASLVRNLKLGPCHLFSHATGIATAIKFASNYPENTRRLYAIDAVPPTNTRERMKDLIGMFKSISLTMSKAPATFGLMARFVSSRLSSFDDPNKKMRRHLAYPKVPLEDLETEDGLNAATFNVRDIMTNRLQQCIAEASTFREDWAGFEANINTMPSTKIFHTKDNPFVTKEGAVSLAGALGCDLIELEDSFPFLEPHLDTIFEDIMDSKK